MSQTNTAINRTIIRFLKSIVIVAGNICGFDASTLELRDGPNSIAPGYLFQYGYLI